MATLSPGLLGLICIRTAQVIIIFVGFVPHSESVVLLLGQPLGSQSGTTPPVGRPWRGAYGGCRPGAPPFAVLLYIVPLVVFCAALLRVPLPLVELRFVDAFGGSSSLATDHVDSGPRHAAIASRARVHYLVPPCSSSRREDLADHEPLVLPSWVQQSRHVFVHHRSRLQFLDEDCSCRQFLSCHFQPLLALVGVDRAAVRP